MFRREPETVMDRIPAWAVAAAATVAASAVVYAVLRGLRLRRGEDAPASELDMLEDAAVDALRRDSVTGSCAIDVAAVAPGIIELSGMVPAPEAGARAARLLHALQGVNTVLNRLEVGSYEERLAHNRDRLARGEPALLERRWYGVRVGTGRRRQSAATEPARPDDTVHRRSRELDVAASLADSASTTPAHESTDKGTAL